MIKLFVTDVDGTMTDGTVGYSVQAGELHTLYSLNFSKLDSQGFNMLEDAQVEVVVLTAEHKYDMLKPLQARINDLNTLNGNRIKLMTWVTDKFSLVQSLIKEKGLTWDEVAYVGDDRSDRNCLTTAMMGYVPSDAPVWTDDNFGVVHLKRAGGHGCVYEAVQDLKRLGLI